MNIATYRDLMKIKDGTPVTLAYVQQGMAVSRMKGRLAHPYCGVEAFVVHGTQGNHGLILLSDKCTVMRHKRKTHIRVELLGSRLPPKCKLDPEVVKEFLNLVNQENTPCQS